MAGKLRPWIAAGLASAAIFAVGFAASEALPRRYRTAGQLEVPTSALRSLPEHWPDSSTVNRWQTAQSPIHAQVEIAEDGSAPKLSVSAEASNAEEAAGAVNAVLNKAQADLTQEGVRFAETRHRALLTLMHHARTERSTAQNKLDQLLFAADRQEAAVASVAPPTPSPAMPENAPAPMVQRRNPLWDDLARQIGELEGRRAGLLVSMTPAHPVIHDLNWRIAQLRSQLQTSPEFTTAPDPTVVAPLPRVAPAPPVVEAAPPMPQEAPEQRDAVRRQRFAVAAADMQLGVAIQQERDAWQQLSELRAELASCVQAAPVPRVAEFSPARDPIRWSSAVLAVLASGAILWRARPKRQTLRTLEDVRRTLGVPVIGKFSAAAR